MSPSFFSLVLVSIYLGGCVAPVHIPPAADGSRPTAVQSSASLTVSDISASDGQQSADLERLAQLRQRRTQERAATDYPIGPGDVLEISVPAMEELKDRAVRVSGEGVITLPFVGTVRAGGLTERELKEEIRRRLEADVMHNPQVNIFVREYRSRQVAVIGAVEKPGLYSLASGADTILDMISLAGGMKEEAAPRIYFIPAEPVENGKAKELASTLPVQLVSKDSSPLILKSADPI